MKTLLHMIKSFLETIAGLFRKNKAKTPTIPENFEDALESFIAIINKLREEDKSFLMSQTTPHDFATTLHHNIGRSIRNEWHLWVEGSPLQTFMKDEFGISHADDISSVISMCAWQKMNEKALTPYVFAEACIEYWRIVEEGKEEGITIEIREDGSVKAHPRKKSE